MTDFIVEWPRDPAGYEIRESNFKKNSKIPGIEFNIVAKSGEVELYEPLKIDGLYKRLADANSTHEGAIEFCNMFGLFFNLKGKTDENPKMGFEVFLGVQEATRQLIEIAETNEWDKYVERAVFGHVTLRLEYIDDKSVPEILFVPDDLHTVMKYQLHADLKSGAKSRKCLICPTWFNYGPGTTHRNTAIYCSPKCQKAHQYQKKKEAAL